MFRFFATCARGIEPILAGEMRELGTREIEVGRGGVQFTGNKTLLYKARERHICDYRTREIRPNTLSKGGLG